jgi:glutaredoxin
MEFSVPQNGWKVFTKENCNYCKKTKLLVSEAEYVVCDEYLKNDRDYFLKKMDLLTGTQHRTFPMVFHDGSFVGGHTETVIYLDKQNAFADVDF